MLVGSPARWVCSPKLKSNENLGNEGRIRLRNHQHESQNTAKERFVTYQVGKYVGSSSELCSRAVVFPRTRGERDGKVQAVSVASCDCNSKYGCVCGLGE